MSVVPYCGALAGRSGYLCADIEKSSRVRNKFLRVISRCSMLCILLCCYIVKGWEGSRLFRHRLLEKPIEKLYLPEVWVLGNPRCEAILANPKKLAVEISS